MGSAFIQCQSSDSAFKIIRWFKNTISRSAKFPYRNIPACFLNGDSIQLSYRDFFHAATEVGTVQDKKEALELLSGMLFDCYGIWSWEYDNNLALLYTNSPSEYFHGKLLLGRDRKEMIMRQGCENGAPLIISNSIGTVWAVVFQKAEGERPQRYYAIGPVFTGEMSRQSYEQLVEPLNLPLDKKWALVDCMQGIPYVTTTVFFQHAITLHYFVTGKKAGVSDFVYYTTGKEALSKASGEEEKKFHSPLYIAERLFDMVRTGNLNYHDVLAEAGIASPGIRLKINNPIRQAKYSVAAFIALCTRSAIEGGLSSECAYTLSDIYTEAVDHANTISQIAAVSHTMYEDLIGRVNRVRREKGISRPVRLCCDYIDNHAEEDISLKELAEKTGYTEYYLARKFKAEMGMSVNTYLRGERVRQSKILLSGTKLTIEEISARFHFCSRSYFSAAFREVEGMTPSEYRERHRE